MADLPYTPPLNPDGGSPRDVAGRINNILRGKINSRGQVTLTENSDTTTLLDDRIGRGSEIFFTPRSANAKAEGSPWCSPITAKGEAELNHANNAQTDRTFGYVIIG